MIDTWTMFWGGVAMVGTGFIAAGAHMLMYARELRNRR